MHQESELEVRIDGDGNLPTLIYLPGLHGDWTLLASFRALANARFRLVQFTYPRTLKWDLGDYARSVDESLKNAGVKRGWILAESYGSQVAWEWLRMAQEQQTDFEFEGIILAGGFVRFLKRFNLALARGFFAIAPRGLWRLLFQGYMSYSVFRHRNAVATKNCAEAFVQRRTPLDIAAMQWRLKLIAAADLRVVAVNAECPIYQLTGVIDPVVPPAAVRRWLRKNCPSFKEHRAIWPADHNVLGTESEQALEQIARWVDQGSVRLASA